MADDATFVEYPKMLYHPNGMLLTVETAEQETKATSEGYVDTPAKYNVETCPGAPPAVPGGFVQPGYPAPEPKAAAAPSPSPPGTPPEAMADVQALEAEAAGRRRH